MVVWYSPRIFSTISKVLWKYFGIDLNISVIFSHFSRSSLDPSLHHYVWMNHFNAFILFSSIIDHLLSFLIFCQDMMNREKKDQLPAMQVGFIDSICLPVYDVSLLISFSSLDFISVAFDSLIIVPLRKRSSTDEGGMILIQIGWFHSLELFRFNEIIRIFFLCILFYGKIFDWIWMVFLDSISRSVLIQIQSFDSKKMKKFNWKIEVYCWGLHHSAWNRSDSFEFWMNWAIVFGFWQAFASLSGKLTPLLEGVHTNRQQWQLLAESYNQRLEQKRQSEQCNGQQTTMKSSWRKPGKRNGYKQMNK